MNKTLLRKKSVIDFFMGHNIVTTSALEESNDLKKGGVTIINDSLDGKEILFNKIFNELKVHKPIQEELFFSIVHEVINYKSLVNDEHFDVNNLLLQLQNMEPEDSYYHAKVKILGEYLHHHFKEQKRRSSIIKNKEFITYPNTINPQMLAI